MSLEPKATMIESSFALEWTIAEERLEELKNSTTNERLESEQYSPFSFSDVKYYLRVYPNGHQEYTRGSTGVCLRVVGSSPVLIESDYTLSIQSAGWSRRFDFDFNGTDDGYGTMIKGFFDPDNRFLADGKCVIKAEGIFRIDSSMPTLSMKESRLFETLWNRGFEDFTISVDGKELKVHKCILASQSPVFEAMFSSELKEGIESRVTIVDFPHEVVKAAIKAVYFGDVPADISIEDEVLIMNFADKYDFSILREQRERSLINKLSLSNVCEIIKLIHNKNAPKLRGICVNLLRTGIEKKTLAANMELLEKEILIEALTNLSCHECKTV